MRGGRSEPHSRPSGRSLGECSGKVRDSTLSCLQASEDQWRNLAGHTPEANRQPEQPVKPRTTVARVSEPRRSMLLSPSSRSRSLRRPACKLRLRRQLFCTRGLGRNRRCSAASAQVLVQVRRSCLRALVGMCFLTAAGVRGPSGSDTSCWFRGESIARCVWVMKVVLMFWTSLRQESHCHPVWAAHVQQDDLAPGARPVRGEANKGAQDLEFLASTKVFPAEFL